MLNPNPLSNLTLFDMQVRYPQGVVIKNRILYEIIEEDTISDDGTVSFIAKPIAEIVHKSGQASRIPKQGESGLPMLNTGRIFNQEMSQGGSEE